MPGRSFSHARTAGLLAVFCTILLRVAPIAAVEVEVQALFTGAAMLKIEGKSQLLKSGESFGGVTLLEANSSRALIELDGKKQQVTVSQRISGSFETPSQRSVSIPRDAMMQYQSQAEINGRRVKVLVDTGANVVAMNSAKARALGISYTAGEPGRVETAAGVVEAWSIVLDSVDVGGIRVDGVRASVIEGDHPREILLGMTFLRHVEMHEKNGVLELSRDY
jgi:aspartyl protease family protein